MKSIYKNSPFIFIALSAVGILISGYLLYNLPTDLEKVSGRIDLNVIAEVQPVLNKVYLILGLTLLLGAIILVQFLFYLNTAKKAQVISTTEKIEVESQQETGQKDDAKTSDLKAQANDILSVAKGTKNEQARIEKILSKLCMKLEASQGIYYVVKKDKKSRSIEMLTSFAFSLPESETLSYEFGEGLAGQVAKEGKKININNVPEGYINIISGLGSASPNHLVIYPIMDGENVVAVAEIASFKEITSADEELITEVLKTDESKAKPVTKPATSPSSKKDEPKADDKKS